MLRAIAISFLASGAGAAVWVGYDGGLAHYGDDGKLLARYDNYRRPVSLTLDRERARLWFIDSYDYKLVCFDVKTGTELFAVTGAAHVPDVTTTDLKSYLSSHRPVEPSLALDAGDGGVWLADFYGHQLAKYDAEGRELFRSSVVHEPFAVAPLGDGSAWVAGSPRTLDFIGPDGKSALSQAGVNEARGLYYDDARDLLVVADYRNNRVLGVDRAGRMKRKITGVELPFAVIAADAAAAAWVATDYAGVKKISLDEEKVIGDAEDSEEADAINLDGAGRLWAAFAEAGELRCYGADGKLLTTIPRLKTPVGVAAE